MRGIATAALDVSDGLVGDLSHVLDASGVGALLSLALIPPDASVAALLHTGARAMGLECLLAGGDDYELCFTAPRAARARIDAIARELLVPCTPIGTIEAGSRLTIHDERGQPLSALPAAYDHFR